MAPPDTNLEKQKRRHKFPLVVMGVVVLLVGVMMLYWLAGLFNPEDAAESEEGSAPIELPDAGVSAPQGTLEPGDPGVEIQTD